MLISAHLLSCGGLSDRGHLATAVERVAKCDFVGASEAADEALDGSSAEVRFGALLVKATAARHLGDARTADAIMEELRAIEAQNEAIAAAASEMDRLASDCPTVQAD